MFTVYDVLLTIFSLAMRSFFREVKTRGSHKIPKTGPVIFCVAPHANQFVDPVMLITKCGRKVGFLAAKKSMDKPHIGIPARIVGAIPVVRPQDLAKNGKGKLIFDKTKPTVFRGEGTAFTEQVQPRTIIKVAGEKGEYEVSEVISDTEVRLKSAVTNEALLATESVGLAYKVIPHVDQSDMFDAVTERLIAGGCVGIFPEGGSHDRPELLPLKAGVAMMALGTMAKDPSVNVKIIPVGLNYFHADKFRSRAVIEFGDPLHISPDLVQKYKNGGADKRTAIGTLLDTIFGSLTSITTTAPDYDTLMVVQAMRRLYKPQHKRLSIDENLQLSRKITEAYLKYRDHPDIIELTKRVTQYNRMLSYYGIRDHQVKRTAVNRVLAITRLVTRALELLFLVVLGLPGAILSAPIWYTARRVASAKMVEAKAGSNVKIWGKDVVATWKVLTALALVPIMLTFYTASTYAITRLVLSLPPKVCLIYTSIAAIVLPSLAWATIHCYDHGADIAKSLRPLWMAAIAGSHAQPLRDLRLELQEFIARIVSELGAEMFGVGFEDSRIVRAEDVEYSLRMERLRRLRTLSNESGRSRSDSGDGADFRWEDVDSPDDVDDVFVFAKNETPVGKTDGVQPTLSGDTSRARPAKSSS
ncbi:uncharacterized protein EV422DRAFT_498745 [Fimicolochytrium jonesii]|uniref:uncharacterized protein n=1 Tax=Fimicolochytrium jonesii TaxID=1396493 RepID=UPI0022FE146A|nr:uncharacterized protein EV422DRAFT_498745 [Fimicolochytrium jonesii]KAI8818554.1 hypothetical protein EV422DRAFT_498745 [Fimicolochytrium jonesii]